MNFFCISDLHLELFRESLTEVDWSFIEKWPLATCLILAGDIGSPLLRRDLLHEFLFRVKKKYGTVFYLPGNHEYYNYDGHTSRAEIEQMLQKICIEVNICFLLRNSYLFNGIKFVGVTLWTHPSEESYLTNTDVSKGKIFTSREEILQLHHAEYKFLDQELLHSQKENIPTVVVTHHLPSYQMIHERYKYFKGNDLFASVTLESLPKEVFPTILYWCAGHTHERVVREKGQWEGIIKDLPLTAITNPVGYRREARVTSVSLETYPLKHETKTKSVDVV